MEANKSTFERPTHEEVLDMFRRAKARQQKLQEEGRTKEEILSWLNAARQRKEAWEKKVDAKFAERLQSNDSRASGIN